jgi:hypothetical protein
MTDTVAPFPAPSLWPGAAAWVADIRNLPRATLFAPVTAKACGDAPARAIGVPRNRLTGIIKVRRALRPPTPAS